MTNIDWGEIVVFLIITAIHAGIVWSKMFDLIDRTKELEKDHVDIKNSHQRMEVHIVNVPSKEDIKELSGKLSNLEKSIVKLEVTMDLVARHQGIPTIMRKSKMDYNEEIDG